MDDRIEEFLKNASIGFPLDWIYVFAYVTIGVGGFIFITGFCGCCGAVRESAWMLAGVRTLVLYHVLLVQKAKVVRKLNVIL